MLDKILHLPLSIVLPTISLLVISTASLVVASFRQGREISFWPPRIGPNPATKDDLKRSARDKLVIPSPTEEYSLKSLALANRHIRLDGTSETLSNEGALKVRSEVSPGQIDWPQVDLTANSIVLLNLLSQTEHSTIHTCHVRLFPERVYVVKRTTAALCQLGALQHLISCGRRRKPTSGIVRSGVPLAAWQEGEYVYELQDFAPGCSVGDLVVRNRLPVARGALLRHLMCELTDELLWLRGIDIIHRDVTPFNVVLSDNRLWLMDWSFCCRSSGPQSPVSTPGFTAPEQIHGAATYASDSYALASSLAFLIIGDGIIHTDLINRVDLRNLTADRGANFCFVYGLSNGTSETFGQEGRFLHQILKSRVHAIYSRYIPASGDGITPRQLLSEMSVLEIQPGSHLVLGDHSWFTTPKDLPTLRGYVAALLRSDGEWNDASAGELRALAAALHPINGALASILGT
jgi:serine/threonine protein kinase